MVNNQIMIIGQTVVSLKIGVYKRQCVFIYSKYVCESKE